MLTVTVLLGVIALLVGAAAFASATLANRRHMAARPAAAATPFGLAARVAALEAARSEGATAEARTAQEELTAQVERLAATVQPVETRVEQLAAELAAELATQRAANDELRAALAVTLERATAAELLAAGTLQQAETTRDVGAALTLQVEHLTGEVDSLTAKLTSVQADPTALRHVAVVRYDAFADLGGRLSFSLAALDASRSGFVLTSLAGKSEVRTYVRAVGHGSGDVTLSAEEQQAIEAACQSAGSTV